MAKGKCQYCGIESGNIKMHERYCEKNSNLTKTPPTPPKEQPQTQQPQVLPLQVHISNLQDILDIGMRVWFDIKDGFVPLLPLKCGTVSISDPNTGANEEFVSVLVLTVNGTLLPPSMIAGFIGIFPEDMVFPEQPTEKPAQQPVATEMDVHAPLLTTVPDSPVVKELPPEEIKTSEAEDALKAFVEKPTQEVKPEVKPMSVGDKLKAALKKKQTP